MRLAAFSDIHGNTIALDAVLTDIERQGGVDGYLVLGDLVAQGHDPVGTMNRLSALPNARFVRGNTDRYVTHRELPNWIDLAEASPKRFVEYTVAIQCHAWTTGCLSATGWLDWVRALPMEERLVLPDRTRVLCVHAAPGLDDGPGIAPNLSDEDLSAQLKTCDANLVLVGHTHWPLDRHAAGVRVVNPGSVGYPWAPDLRASYVIIEADASGYRITQHRAAFDIAAAVASIQASSFFPNPEWLVGRLTGGQRAPWDQSAATT